VYAYAWSNSIVPVVTPTLPQPPVGMKATLNKSAATLTWMPPYNDGGSKINLFRVTMTSPGQPKRTYIGLGMKCTFGGLIKGHAYHVTATSRNAVGTSVSSKTYTFIAG
jgi:hypothetical protein